MANVLILRKNETHYTTKIFKGTNLHVAYKKKNTPVNHFYNQNLQSKNKTNIIVVEFIN
jgi:hypothetical protein